MWSYLKSWIPVNWEKKAYAVSSEDTKWFSNNVNHAHKKLYGCHPIHKVIPILFIICKWYICMDIIQTRNIAHSIPLYIYTFFTIRYFGCILHPYCSLQLNWCLRHGVPIHRYGYLQGCFIDANFNMYNPIGGHSAIGIGMELDWPDVAMSRRLMDAESVTIRDVT